MYWLYYVLFTKFKWMAEFFFLGLIFSKTLHESFPYAILHQLINCQYQFVFLNLCHALHDLSSSSFFYKISNGRQGKK